MKRLSVALLVCLAGYLSGVSGQQPASNPAYVPGEVIVKFRPGASQSRRDTVLAAWSARVLHHFGQFDMHHLALPVGQSVEAAVAALSANPDVLFAQPNYVRHATDLGNPNDPLWLNGTLWGL